MAESDLTPRGCPRFDFCNANVCPLDPGWRKTVHLPGEAICRYLLCTGKAGAAEYFAGDRVFPVALALVGEVGERFPAIAREVARSARKTIAGAQRKGRRIGEPAAPPPPGQT